MRKILNKVVSVAIICILIISYLLPLKAFAESSKYRNYLALGDSIAYGYGLEKRETESYSAIVKTKYNIPTNNYQNLAVSGMKCSQFYQKIQEKEYTDAIKNADLITISIGSNELLKMATAVVAQVTGVPTTDPNFVEKVKKVVSDAGLIEKYKMLNQMYQMFTSEEMKTQLEAEIASYKENWIKSINYIKSINSDVTIVATEFYNPYYEIGFASYDLGGFSAEWIEKMNVVLTEESNEEQNYKIAKIYKTFNTTNPRLTNVSLTAFNIDPHPNKAGHEIIANKILDVLTTADTKKNVASLTISNIKEQTYTGKEIEPEITIKDGNTILTKDQDYTVTYINNIEIGQATAVILGIGNYEGKVEKTFNIKNKEQKDITKLTISSIEDQTYTGIKIEPDIEISDGNEKLKQNVDYELDYSNNINTGTASVKIKGIGNYTGEQNKNFTIIAKNISNVEISNIANQKYTGESIEPEVNITDGSAKLVKGQDYNITYQNNIEKGTATVTITGIKNYTGTIDKTFEIEEDSTNEATDISTLQITEIENKIYTGKLITPEVRIMNGEKEIIKGTDYTINYINNINIGQATAIIKGIGNYKGEVQKNFEIIQKEIEHTTIADIKEQKYTGKEIKPKVYITSDHIELKENTDYTVEYSNNINTGTATIEISGKGNYTGKIVKTFNIVDDKNKDEDNDKKNDKDDKKDDDKGGNKGNNKGDENKETNTIIADSTKLYSKLPDAGKKALTIVTIVFVIVSVIFYILYRKYKFVK